MKIERTKNASRNILFGVLLRTVQIIVPFLMRTAITYFIGIEYLGLDGLFKSLLQVLNLAELGVGSAMIYSMYKPIAEDDEKSICALMRLYKIYYRAIGAIVLVFGLILFPFVPKLIKGDVPDEISVYILYFFNLAATVLSYWLFAYKNCLLDAHQRNDVTSKVTLITNLLQYTIQLLVLWLLKSYYAYVLTMLITQALTNVTIAIVVTKMFPKYNPKGKLSKDEVNTINKRIRDLFTSKLGAVIVNSADTIVISAFLGLTVLAVYQNYYFVITAIISVITIVFNACLAGIGNSLIVETKEKNFQDLKKFTFIISWIACVCSTCFICVFQPFMELWMGADHLLPFSAVICMVVYYYIYEINQLLNVYKDAAGIWHEDRFRPLITGIANVVLNLIMVQFWGIYGVLLSTVLSMLLIGMPWLLHNLFSILFNMKDVKSFICSLIMYFGTTAIICAICLLLCSMFDIPLILKLGLNLFISVLLSNVVYFVLYRKKKEFVDSVEIIDRMTKGKLKLKKFLCKKKS